jgi:hypothetical protein
MMDDSATVGALMLDTVVAAGDVETVGVLMMDDSATVGALMLDAVVAVGVLVVTFRSIGSDRWAAHVNVTVAPTSLTLG